jgi:hypothetical protein
MTREEATKLLEQWVATHDASHSACRQFMAPFGAEDWDCVAVKHVLRMFDAYTEVLRKLLNAPRYECPEFNSDLEWYCNENDMGRKAMDAMGGNITEMRPIACIDDLLDLLGDCYESQSQKFGVFVPRSDGGTPAPEKAIQGFVDTEREAKILAERMANHLNCETEVREIFVQVGDVVKKKSEKLN